MAVEWDFNEDSELVDIDRIYNELKGHTTFEVMCYTSDLKKNAPIVYTRFKTKYDGKLGCVALL